MPYDISTHAPRAGSDLNGMPRWYRLMDFNPRSPCGERPERERVRHEQDFRISTHAPRAGSDRVLVAYHMFEQISTHAPRAGSDFAHHQKGPVKADFNPRSPCGERLMRTACVPSLVTFQPTLPVRGATTPGMRKLVVLDISTHAPRAGSDRTLATSGLPTRSISTHAPRAGSDRTMIAHWLMCMHFNPRSPCGERPNSKLYISSIILFQPTLPVRGATCEISAPISTPGYFNPRSPCGERHVGRIGYHNENFISTHAPRAGSDWHRCL